MPELSGEGRGDDAAEVGVMMGYDALAPYMKRGDDMGTLEAGLKVLEGMLERPARMQAQLANVLNDLDEAKRMAVRMVMQVKKIQGEAQDIIEGVQS